MIRYIEEEAIIKAIDESGQRYGITTANRCNFKEIVRKTPTADVVPKSEVAREIFEEIDKLLECCFSSCYINATEEQFDFYRADLGFQISELKKKYTGDQT